MEQSVRCLTFSLLYFQRIAAIKQALNAHDIRFFLRGGYWVLVTLADSDSGKYINKAPKRPTFGCLSEFC